VTRIVVYEHRPKRPPLKQTPSALTLAAQAATKVPTIARPTGEKQLKRLRMERAQQATVEPSPDALYVG
jgi:hypothetical protein